MTRGIAPRRRRHRPRRKNRLRQLREIAFAIYDRALAIDRNVAILTREEFAEAMRDPAFRVVGWYYAMLEEAQVAEVA